MCSANRNNPTRSFPLSRTGTQRLLGPQTADYVTDETHKLSTQQNEFVPSRCVGRATPTMLGSSLVWADLCQQTVRSPQVCRCPAVLFRFDSLLYSRCNVCTTPLGMRRRLSYIPPQTVLPSTAPEALVWIRHQLSRLIPPPPAPAYRLDRVSLNIQDRSQNVLTQFPLLACYPLEREI